MYLLCLKSKLTPEISFASHVFCHLLLSEKKDSDLKGQKFVSADK